MADDAVHGEPVSAPNSLLTGKNTGKFAKLGPSQLLPCLVVSVFRPLWPNFPKQSNREFWARKQGSYYPEQGSHSAQVGPSPAQITSGSGPEPKEEIESFPGDVRQFVSVAESQPRPVPCHTNDRDRAHPPQLA